MACPLRVCNSSISQRLETEPGQVEVVFIGFAICKKPHVSSDPQGERFQGIPHPLRNSFG